jgi:hypothetical protein
MRSKSFARLHRIGAGIDYRGGVVIVVAIAVTVAVVFDGFGGRRRFRRCDHRGGDDVVLDGIGINESAEEIGEAHFLALDVVHQTHKFADYHRAGGDGVDALPNAVLDALGEVDFVFAGEQIHGTHFAHVHANRVGGAAKLAFHGGGEHGLGLFDDFLVVGVGMLEDQAVGIGGIVIYLDTHVVDHVDDRFDLVGIVHILRQMIVDLTVGQESLLLALEDETFQLGLLRFWIHSDLV